MIEIVAICSVSVASVLIVDMNMPRRSINSPLPFISAYPKPFLPYLKAYWSADFYIGKAHRFECGRFGPAPINISFSLKHYRRLRICLGAHCIQISRPSLARDDLKRRREFYADLPEFRWP